jgi:hypothetical protein
MARDLGVIRIVALFAWLAQAGSCSSSDRGDGDRSGGPKGGAKSGGSGTGGKQKDAGDPFNNADAATRSDGAVRRDGAEPTGTCGQGCFETGAGVGSDAPFDPASPGASNVGVDADGALVLERDDDTMEELIWIANTREGTVSKVDTNTLTEIGRYNVPAVDWNIEPDENGPSRTSVDSEGNVYAGARLGSGVTKISAAGADCPDSNGDGMITTSSGPADVLDPGQDDCVIWSAMIDGDARGVAVQEIAPKLEVEVQPDAPPVITEIPGARYVWVGGQITDAGRGWVPRLHKLDAETGEILLTLDPPPAPTYGLALDGRGNLWISGRQRNSLARVDTTRCLDNGCNAETVCVTQCTETSCPDTCDGAVLERIELARTTYGITVDCSQRVWLGGAHGGTGVMRYDPLAGADARLAWVSTVAGNDEEGVHGIAADASGWIWGGARDLGVWRVDSETLEAVQVAGTGGAEFNAKGMAVDRRGRVWAIPFRMDYAMVITPGATIDDAVVEKPISGFAGPYTYSDMTGEQRRLAANEPGTYRQVFEGCKSSTKPTMWRNLSWDADLPTGTYLVFRARSAATRAGLETAQWVELTAVPGRDSPLEVADFFASASQTLGLLVEVEVQLVTTEIGSESKDGCSAVPAITPRVKSFGLDFLCAADVG